MWRRTSAVPIAFHMSAYFATVRSVFRSPLPPMQDVLDDDTFWVGTPEHVASMMIERRALGFQTFIAEMAAPFDDETLERWIGEVRPMVDAA